jgi:hypothetical protein
VINRAVDDLQKMTVCMHLVKKQKQTNNRGIRVKFGTEILTKYSYSVEPIFEFGIMLMGLFCTEICVL